MKALLEENSLSMRLFSCQKEISLSIEFHRGAEKQKTPLKNHSKEFAF
jgi:hypothetical protein